MYCAWFIWKDINAATFEGELASAEAITRKAVACPEEQVEACSVSSRVKLGDVETIKVQAISRKKHQMGALNLILIVSLIIFQGW